VRPLKSDLILPLRLNFELFRKRRVFYKCFLSTEWMIEAFEKCSILFKVKKGENIALTLHFVQPQAYIEYSAD